MYTEKDISRIRGIWCDPCFNHTILLKSKKVVYNVGEWSSVRFVWCRLEKKEENLDQQNVYHTCIIDDGIYFLNLFLHGFVHALMRSVRALRDHTSLWGSGGWEQDPSLPSSRGPLGL